MKRHEFAAVTANLAAREEGIDDYEVLPTSRVSDIRVAMWLV
jgi:hypothetical protein